MRCFIVRLFPSGHNGMSNISEMKDEDRAADEYVIEINETNSSVIGERSSAPSDISEVSAVVD